jgi:hypothetical protein
MQKSCFRAALLGGALENWSNFQTPQLLMKFWDLLDNMCVVVDLKWEQKIPLGSASSLAAKRVEKFELMTPWAFLTFQGKIRVFWGYIWYFRVT